MMRVPKPLLVFICVLIGALLVRAAISATMPINMMGQRTALATSVAESAESVTDDCPGHRVSASSETSGDSSPSSCAWCGECCVSAPLLTFDPDLSIAKIAPQVFDVWLNVPHVTYLTPGRFRPPAA